MLQIAKPRRASEREFFFLGGEDVKKQLYEIGMEQAPTTPGEFQQIIAQEIALHAELVKASGLVPQ